MPGSTQDVWIPLVFPPNVARDYHYLSAVARLKRGVTIDQAHAEMSAIAAGIAKAYPALKKDWGASVDLHLNCLVGSQLRPSLKVLMWAVVAYC
jgi:putative ABC transport system permease protein